MTWAAWLLVAVVGVASLCLHGNGGSPEERARELLRQEYTACDAIGKLADRLDCYRMAGRKYWEAVK